MKMRNLKALLRRRGYICRPGKGSHSIWMHPTRPAGRLVLNGADGDDAKLYQIRRARKGFARRSLPTLPRRLP